MKEKRAFSISHTESMPIYLRIYMAVGNKYVGPAIIVSVEEFHSEPQERDTDRSEIGGSGDIGEFTIVIVVKQIVRVVREIGFRDVGPPIIIVIRGVDPHSGLLPPVATVCKATLRTYLRESAFAVAFVKHARRRVVRNIQIEASIEVIVEP